MGIRQVKDLFKRGTTRKWSGVMFDTWAAKEPRGVHAFGGQQKFNRQINLIMATASHALTIVRTKTIPPVWTKDELVAYYDLQGEPHYGTIIDPRDLTEL